MTDDSTPDEGPMARVALDLISDTRDGTETGVGSSAVPFRL